MSSPRHATTARTPPTRPRNSSASWATRSTPTPSSASRTPIKEVRESLEADDPAAINAKTEALQTAFHAISEAMYQRAQESAAADGGNGNGASASPDGDSADDEDVVDAEVVDEPKA